MSRYEDKSRGPAGSQFSKGAKKDSKDTLRVNREIRAPQIRVIDEAGGQLGVMTVPEALRLAEERGLDLLEIAPTAQPPTCKIMDYGKWKYENKKKATAARKKQVIVSIKEIQMRPRTDQHDFETKMKHARRFILEGDKVKVNLRFLGREMSHQELGLQVLNKAVDFVKDLAMVESPPKSEGKNMFLLLAPDPLKVKDYLKANPKSLAHKEKEDEEFAALSAKDEVDED